MNLETKVEQLTDLLAELTPAVDAEFKDSLVASQRITEDNVKKLAGTVGLLADSQRITDQNISKMAGTVDLLVASQRIRI